MLVLQPGEEEGLWKRPDRPDPAGPRLRTRLLLPPHPRRRRVGREQRLGSGHLQPDHRECDQRAGAASQQPRRLRDGRGRHLRLRLLLRHLLQPRRHPAQGDQQQRGGQRGGQPGAGAVEALVQPAAAAAAAVEGGAQREDCVSEVADPPADPSPSSEDHSRAVRGRAKALPGQLLREEAGQRQEGVAPSTPEKCLQAHLGRPIQTGTCPHWSHCHLLSSR